MKRFAFIQRQTLERVVWVEAQTAAEARRRLLDPNDWGRGIDSGDLSGVTAPTLRRDPSQDADE